MQELLREYLNEIGKKQKKRRRFSAVAAIFAIVVVASVIWGLTRTGIATTGEPKCGQEEHQHTEECYSSVLVCGQEESEGHVHTEECYQTEDVLVCGQEESEEHTHTEECYQTEVVLVCGQEESEGHTHTDACYEEQLTCGMEEHQHTDACYIDTNADVEDASEWAAQYENVEWKELWGEDLVIAAQQQLDYKESIENYIVAEDGTHKGYTRYGQFADDSYIDWDASFVNFCMYYAGLSASEMFPNEKVSSEWYDKLVEMDEGKNLVYLTAPEGYEPETGDIIFLKNEDRETELQMGIVSSYDKETNEIKVIEGNSDNKVQENTYDAADEHISEYLKINEMEEAYKYPEAETEEPSDVLTEEEKTENEAEIETEETESEAETETENPEEKIEKVYTSDSFIVTASYSEDAGIPEEAELVAEQITADADEAHYAERESEFKAMVENEKAVMKALLKIGFYINGEEVEPQSPVTITVQFLDENGLAEGKPISIVHFAEQGTEVLDGSTANNNSTTFQTESFSEFAIGESVEEEAIANKEAFPINRSFEYEDDVFHITFRVVGEAMPTEEQMPEEMKEAADAEVVISEEGERETAEKYQFKVSVLDETSEEHIAFEKYTEQTNDGYEQLILQVMRYALFYDGVKLDLTDCKVTAEVTTTEKLKEYAEEAEKALSEEDSLEEADNSEEEDAVSENGFSLFGADRGTELGKSSPLSLSEDTVQSVLGEVTAELEDSAGGILTGEVIEEPEIIVTAYVQEAGEISKQNSITLTSSETSAMAVDMEESDIVAVGATSNTPNPNFTVQYYANLEVVAYNDPALRKVIGSTSYTNELPVIDTAGGKLPANGGGSTASPNGNEIRNLYVDMTSGKLQTKTELTEVYKSRSFEYHKAPTINYMNALVENPGYELKEVWVLKEGEEADSTDESDWDIHTYSTDLHFTNRAVSAESGDYVLISNDSTLRFVYKTTDNDKEFEAAFYDYDIGDGLIYSTQLNAQKQTNGKPTSTQGSGTYHMHTNQSGINSPGNYTGSGAKLAFGNANTGSGLQHELWGGNLLNKANQTQSGHPSVTGSYKGCTFGLVTGLADGKVQYAGNVNAPNLFNDGSAAGKTSYDNGEFSLTFNRVGDTHTLTTVNGTGTGDLDTFNHPSPNASTVHNHIWTNNFWPMDSAASFGTDGHDMKFGDYTNRENYKFAGQAGSSGGSAAANGTFPWSDDGEDHNSYFGMHYKVEFDLVEDYVGPLEYYFFGDDDMWVFLDGTLVCDIGGVHSSVGEYVNLWDYLEKGSEEAAGKHTLSFFYTERGESGSTCWMQFTLPSVSSLTPETTDEDYGQLKVEKTVTQVNDDNTESVVDNNDEFTFTIHFTDADGNNLPDDYAYVKYDKNGNEIGSDLIIWDGGQFTLKNGEYIIVKFLPAGTKYEVTEADQAITVTDDTSETSQKVYITDITSGGKMDVDLESNKIADGTIAKGSTVDVKYNNKFYIYQLPSTGGIGIYWYMFSGVLLISVASLITYRKKCRGVLRS